MYRSSAVSLDRRVDGMRWEQGKTVGRSGRTEGGKHAAEVEVAVVRNDAVAVAVVLQTAIPQGVVMITDARALTARRPSNGALLRLRA